MIVLLAASSITLTALQASINAPRDAFKTCLKDASSKAMGEKVTAEAYEAYIRNACSTQLGTFKAAPSSSTWATRCRGRTRRKTRTR